MFSTVREAYKSLTDNYYEDKCDELEAEYQAMMRKLVASGDGPSATLFGQLAAAMVANKLAHRIAREKQYEEIGADHADDGPPIDSVHLDTPASDNVDDL